MNLKLEEIEGVIHLQRNEYATDFEDDTLPDGRTGDAVVGMVRYYTIDLHHRLHHHLDDIAISSPSLPSRMARSPRHQYRDWKQHYR